MIVKKVNECFFYHENKIYLKKIVKTYREYFDFELVKLRPFNEKFKSKLIH
jgi:hypothetical protein